MFVKRVRLFKTPPFFSSIPMLGMFLSICFVFNLNCYSEIIKGIITDKDSGKPIDSVTIHVDKYPLVKSLSNKSGTYEINTEMVSIVETPAIQWNKTMLYNTIQNGGANSTATLYNIRGSIIANRDHFMQSTSLNDAMSPFSSGIYFLTFSFDNKTVNLKIAKTRKNELSIQSKERPIQQLVQPMAEVRSFSGTSLVFNKSGYAQEIRQTVSGQATVDLAMQRVAVCGNKIIELKEVCDGNNDSCNLIAPMIYRNGNAPCNTTCDDYLVSSCTPHPVCDVSGNATGTSYLAATKMTAAAQFEILKHVRPGLLEGAMHVIVDSVFRANKSTGYAFNTITGSGPNSLILHYEGKTRKMVDGDLLLVDIGAQSSGWCGDISRTYPVNGKFTPRQKEVYNLVLDVLKASAAAMKANGMSLNQVSSFAKEKFKASPLRAKDKSGVSRTMDVFFVHSLSHYIGKNVHGQDLTFTNSEPVKPGRIFTIEPGLYIESEGFGIRLENDYIMTATGAQDLFPNLPIEADHIEALMARHNKGTYLGQEVDTTSFLKAEPTNRNHMDF